MGEMRNAYRILVSENLEWRDHLRDLVVDGRIMLKWILSGFSVVEYLSDFWMLKEDFTHAVSYI
jgi:hypothetical protein